MKRSQRLPDLLSALKRIGLAVSFFWLVGCSSVYTTHLVSVSDSFEVDERLIGKWSALLLDTDLHIEFNEDSDQLYAIYHGSPNSMVNAKFLGRCVVVPIYTTHTDDQWFMNQDMRRSRYCTDPDRSPALEDEVWEFKELYQLVKYEIRAIPVEDILAAAATLALQELEQLDQESLEKEVGFKLELNDLNTVQKLLDRLVASLQEVDSYSEVKLEMLEFEYMSPEVVGSRLREGRLAGKCFGWRNEIAELEEWNPTGTSTEVQTPTGTENQETDSSPPVSKPKTCSGPLVITDTEEKIKSLMLLTDEDGLFSGPSKNDEAAEKEHVFEPFYQLLEQIPFGALVRLKFSDLQQE